MQFYTERSEWERKVDVKGRVDFEGIAPTGCCIAKAMGGEFEVGGVVFSAPRCISVLDPGYHPYYQWECGSSLSVATKARPHTLQPDCGPLRATPPAGTEAVAAEVYTVVPHAEPVLLRVKLADSDQTHEQLVQTFEQPHLAFFGTLYGSWPIEWVEFDLAPGAENHYVTLASFTYGTPRQGTV